MRSNKKAIIFSAICMWLLPQMSFAAGGTADDKSANYNVTLLTLSGLMVILLFVIGLLGATLRHLVLVVKEKNRKEMQKPRAAAKTTLLLLLLLSSFASFAATGDAAVQSTTFISGIPETDFYFIIGVIALELLVIFSLVYYIYMLLNVIRDVPARPAKIQGATQWNWFWDRFNSAAAIEKEADILLDHNYDGIMELDNSLPPWWKYGFYLTILVAFIYVYRYHVSHDGPSQQDEYVAEMQQGEDDKAAYLAKSANNVDENTVVLLSSAGDIANGKEVFIKNCAACHMADGGGTVGPNLTDDYWLHGGGLKDIFKSIKYGWQDKGMKSWKDDLSPKQMQEVASFIRNLKGTHPAVPKSPQGELYIEAQQPAGADSASKKKITGI